MQPFLQSSKQNWGLISPPKQGIVLLGRSRNRKALWTLPGSAKSHSPPAESRLSRGSLWSVWSSSQLKEQIQLWKTIVIARQQLRPQCHQPHTVSLKNRNPLDWLLLHEYKWNAAWSIVPDLHGDGMGCPSPQLRELQADAGRHCYVIESKRSCAKMAWCEG